jgi:hypothetical protein
MCLAIGSSRRRCPSIATVLDSRRLSCSVETVARGIGSGDSAASSNAITLPNGQFDHVVIVANLEMR